MPQVYVNQILFGDAEMSQEGGGYFCNNTYENTFYNHFDASDHPQRYEFCACQTNAQSLCTEVLHQQLLNVNLISAERNRCADVTNLNTCWVDVDYDNNSGSLYRCQYRDQGAIEGAEAVANNVAQTADYAVLSTQIGLCANVTLSSNSLYQGKEACLSLIHI